MTISRRCTGANSGSWKLRVSHKSPEMSVGSPRVERRLQKEVSCSRLRCQLNDFSSRKSLLFSSRRTQLSPKTCISSRPSFDAQRRDGGTCSMSTEPDVSCDISHHHRPRFDPHIPLQRVRLRTAIFESLIRTVSVNVENQL